MGGYNGGGNSNLALGTYGGGGGGGASDIRIGGTAWANIVVSAGGGGVATYYLYICKIKSFVIRNKKSH